MPGFTRVGEELRMAGSRARARAFRSRRVLVGVATAVAVVGLWTVPASAAVRSGSVSDPQYDSGQRPDGSYLGNDISGVDVIYNDALGQVDVIFRLHGTVDPNSYNSGYVALGQSWRDGECVTTTAQYDISFSASWSFSGHTLTWSLTQMWAVGVSSFYTYGSGASTPSVLRAVAEAPVYKNRNYVCVGDVSLGTTYYVGGSDRAADFQLSGGAIDPPAPAIPGTVDVAGPLVLDKSAYKPGEVMTGTAVWRNPGESSVTTRHLVLGLRPAGAPEGEGFIGDFSPVLTDRTLAPGETVAHTATFRIPSDVTPGPWVLWASWQDTSNVWHGSATLPVTISSAQDQSSPPANPSSTPGENRSAPLVVATVQRSRLRRALRRGLVVETQLSQAGRVNISALLGRRQAALLGLPRTIGGGSASLGEDVTKRVRVRFSSRARRVLSRLSRLKLTLKIHATGESGKQRVTTRAVTLRR